MISRRNFLATCALLPAVAAAVKPAVAFAVAAPVPSRVTLVVAGPVALIYRQRVGEQYDVFGRRKLAGGGTFMELGFRGEITAMAFIDAGDRTVFAPASYYLRLIGASPGDNRYQVIGHDFDVTFPPEWELGKATERRFLVTFTPGVDRRQLPPGFVEIAQV